MYCMCNDRDEAAHELSFNLIETIFHQFVAKNRYHFNVHAFICQQINKRSLEVYIWCRHNHGHHDKEDRTISDIAEMMEMKDISIDDYITTRLFDLYPQHRR